MIRRADAEVGHGLALAVLAAPAWDDVALVATICSALGRPAPWSETLAFELTEMFRERPDDRPGALREAILGSESFLVAIEEAHARGEPLRLRHLAASRTAMRAARWPVPTVHDERGLADLLRIDLEQLLWLADLRGYQRRTPDGPLQTYRYHWRAAPGRTPRLLEEPTPVLKAVQRRLLDRLIGRIPVHSAAYGFVPGRSACRHAGLHTGADWVLSMDLRAFFSHVGRNRLHGLFSRAGYPDPVVRLLGGLVTTRTPLWALRRMPAPDDGAAPDARRRLLGRLRDWHLPQGSPTSPALANAVCFALDRRLAGLAENQLAHYSRYADDLTFSGRGRPPRRLVDWVSSVVTSEGFVINETKTRLSGRGARQSVTGVVVNVRTNLARPEHDRLRAILHDAGLNGPAAANRDGHADFAAHLSGRIGWVEQLNPQRGARLRAQFVKINWADDNAPGTDAPGPPSRERVSRRTW